MPADEGLDPQQQDPVGTRQYSGILSQLVRRCGRHQVDDALGELLRHRRRVCL
ncbi:hypothetical protein ACFPZI_32030 [Streptomyces chlorus]|uniref:Uncharacterized protein n=1 Tax=Streptomyces chlorus TaxID=887452 RepID=A0ABW1E6V5_9ACTN